ncbi:MULTISPECIES: isopentenyl-diphosphate Delta-isomerase [Protofrankia]|uniref:Isopentenyl-diphosphate Delta-isomerase n=1 Tax=Protofrankia coriariae TaxID=1562887 RepID=A0ABR5EZH0_9ACTN|nr:MULTISPECIES: isopentenyl-diphosphate Delta-isomerase [Protofrankia]KLL09837.1 isopentenyl-diphosphate delta-isomerase [Protofrankia coriariae]ONH31822.1 isopentenyl-diphosphate delta-isomerase [Protofrankia sp. BMG5.30]
MSHSRPYARASSSPDSPGSDGTAGAAAELVVLLSPSGEAVGVTPKATVHGPRTPLHLAFSCYVFDAADRILVTRRAHAKRTWPGVLTNTCCGHPAPGEDFRTAVSRRLAEELNLRVQRIDLALPTFRYRCVMTDGTVENEICPVFFAQASDDFRINPEEVAEAYWTPWSTFSEDVLNGSLEISPWCRLQMARLRPLGPSPRHWPVAPDEALPPAARQNSRNHRE